MDESSRKSVLELVERLGLPVVLAGIFIYALWLRTNSFLQAQKDMLDKDRALCEKQIEVLEEIRDILKPK